MGYLLQAIQFLTIFPLKTHREFNPGKILVYFPMVGLLIGGILCLFDSIFISLWPINVASLLDILLLIGITGALHLDGLGDTADGLYGHRTTEKALAIMKDSRIGSMGLIAIVCGIAVKWAGISVIYENRYLLLLLIPAYARASVLFGIRFLNYGRTEEGTGFQFFEKKPSLASFTTILPLLFLSCFLKWQFFILNSAFIVITSGLILFYKKKINCITGDMLGAMIEINEAGLFLFVAAGVSL